MHFEIQLERISKSIDSEDQNSLIAYGSFANASCHASEFINGEFASCLTDGGFGGGAGLKNANFERAVKGVHGEIKNYRTK